jgi:hypothetical protein
MRISDFSLILFLTDAIPGTLLYISIYGLTKALVAVLLSSWVAQSTRRLSRLHALQLALHARGFPWQPHAFSSAYSLYSVRIRASEIASLLS